MTYWRSRGESNASIDDKPGPQLSWAIVWLKRPEDPFCCTAVPRKKARLPKHLAQTPERSGIQYLSASSAACLGLVTSALLLQRDGGRASPQLYCIWLCSGHSESGSRKRGDLFARPSAVLELLVLQGPKLAKRWQVKTRIRFFLVES